MAFLGDSGALTLQREQALPGVLKAANLNLPTSSVLMLDGAYMTGDQVTLQLTGGLPLQGATATETYWIHRDVLDRISFYASPQNAINAFSPVRFTSSSWADITITQAQPPVKFVADIREWRLDLDAAAIDTTPIGVKFGENIRDVITGGGNFNFLVERRNDEEIANGIDLLNLLFLTGAGGKASCEFWLNTGRTANGCEGLLSGSLYYQADILITSSSVSVRPDQMIEGVANFVTTGDIALKMATFS